MRKNKKQKAVTPKMLATTVALLSLQGLPEPLNLTFMILIQTGGL
ncbi:MAG TPA: hypothetical protein VJ765_01750 [Chitinophagaceae bacterium]|nr:hypothetical protein [Chitinophagaceae bacterium]